MIRKVHIEGYQSHVDTTIEFHPHLNVIVGPSNAGKSVILRALKKVIRDLPAGHPFVNKNTDTCKITIDNGFQITRRIVTNVKGTTKTNEYSVDDQLFDSFGREIPQEVINALNMPIINFGEKLDIDLHFAGQHDGNFLLDETSSVQSKVLGRISGLNVIDGAIQTVKIENRRTTTALKVIDADIEQLNLEIQALPDIIILKTQVINIETAFSQLEKQHSQLTVLQELEKQLIDLAQRGNTLRNEVEALPNLDNLNFDTIKTKIDTLNQYKQSSDSLNNLNLQITTLENDPTLNSVVVFDNFDQIKDKIIRRNELTQLKTDLDQKNMFILQLDNSLTQLDIDSNTAIQDWETLLQKLGVCPTCKQPTKDVKF